MDKQPLADGLAELQAQIDAFDDICNTERPHQGYPAASPRAGWDATDLAAGTRVTKLSTAAFMLTGVTYKVGGRRALEQVLVMPRGPRQDR